MAAYTPHRSLSKATGPLGLHHLFVHHCDRSETTACGAPTADLTTVYGSGAWVLVDCPACRVVTGMDPPPQGFEVRGGLLFRRERDR